MAASFDRMGTGALSGPLKEIPQGTSLEITEIDRPTFPFSLALLNLYLELAETAGGLPNRKDFDVSTLLRLGLVRNFYVSAPVEDGEDWIYRLMGTGITSRFGFDRTNRKMKDFLNPETATRLVALNNTIAKEGKPKVFQLLPQEPHLSWLTAETMSLPVKSPDEQEVWLVGGTFFSDEHGPKAVT